MTGLQSYWEDISMQTADDNRIPITVELEDMFSYAPVGLIIVAIILILVAVFFIVLVVKKHKKPENKVIEVKQLEGNRLESYKAKYIAILDTILAKYSRGEISERVAYQELSKAIRHFVHAVTGIKVQNYTLSEIGKINLPNLYYLIAECYVPEFDENGTGDVNSTVYKARKVIEEWN